MTQPLETVETLPYRIVPRAFLLGGLLLAFGCAEPDQSTGVPGETAGDGSSAGGTTGTSSSGGSGVTGGNEGNNTSGTGGKNGSGTPSGGGTGGSSSATTGGTTSTVPVSDKFEVRFLTYSPTQLSFFLKNTNTDTYSYVPLASLRMRYWFTPEGPLSAYTTRCDQIDSDGNTVKCSQVVMTIVEGDPAALDISFDVPATWRFWGTAEISRLNVGLQGENGQGTQADLTNDYSYMNTSDFKVNEKVALYQDGVLVWGEEPEGASLGTGGTEATGGAAGGGSVTEPAPAGAAGSPYS